MVRANPVGGRSWSNTRSPSHGVRRHEGSERTNSSNRRCRGGDPIVRDRKPQRCVACGQRVGVLGVAAQLWQARRCGHGEATDQAAGDRRGIQQWRRPQRPRRVESLEQQRAVGVAGGEQPHGAMSVPNVEGDRLLGDRRRVPRHLEHARFAAALDVDRPHRSGAPARRATPEAPRSPRHRWPAPPISPVVDARLAVSCTAPIGGVGRRRKQGGHGGFNGGRRPGIRQRRP
jgi:hypothetical protein